MKIEIFKKKKSFRKGGIHINPDICWEIIIYIAFAIIIGSFIFGFYLFMQIDKGFIFSEDQMEQQSRTIDKQRVEKALEYFSEREKKSVQIINSSPTIIDPSL